MMTTIINLILVVKKYYNNIHMPGLNLIRPDGNIPMSAKLNVMLGQRQGQRQGQGQIQFRRLGTNNFNSMNMISRVVNSRPGCSSCGR
jgi:hypothetical protein